MTQELAERYFEGQPPYSFRGFAAVIGGEPVGIAGVFRAYGRMWAFSGMKEDLRPYRKARVKAVRKLVSLLDSMPCPVYATADPNEPTAEKLLSHLGFVGTDERHEGNEILVRRPLWRGWQR